MSYRFMRMLIFFDLPMLTDKDKREYRIFHKFLIKKGFIMMQKSVYSKLALNNTVVDSLKIQVRKNSPPDGLLQMLVVTEKQFNSIEYILGKKQSNIIDSDKRLIEL